MFKQNVGGVERAARIVVGIIILSQFFFLDSPAKFFTLIGLLPLGTGFIGWCPPYAIFGFSTCSAAEKEEAAS